MFICDKPLINEALFLADGLSQGHCVGLPPLEGVKSMFLLNLVSKAVFMGGLLGNFS
jgi:hypothetical protein